MRKLLTTVVLIFCVNATFGEESSPVVNLPLGKVEGFTDTSLEGRTFYTFKGVPYARPPVGKYRFREPEPVKPWPGVWKAKTLYKCMQYNHYTPPGEDFVIGDEDCLYLNIHTPTLDRDAKLDVIAYIHGGAFMFHYAAFQEPHYLLDKDVVIVSLSYRLGPLGFLSTEDDVVPGNNGIKDQTMALQWIKDNIRYFGGNPESVTLSGMSAGGASVHLHYLAPKSRGLFHRGISQSGAALNPWVVAEAPLEKAKTVASAVGCPTADVKEMVECLTKRPGRQIVHAVKQLQPWLYNPFSPFGVVVDTWASDPVFPDHPYNLLKRGEVADVPWIASYVGSEGLYPGGDFYNDEHLRHIDSHWNEVMPHILHYNDTVHPSVRGLISDQIRKFYLKGRPVDKSTFMDLIQILSDRLFVSDIERAARLQASVTESPVYVYYFVYRGAHSRSEDRTGTNKDLGAAHGDDTSYVFKTSLNTTSTGEDRKMVKLFVELFRSFAKNGIPQVPSEWPPLSKNLDDPFVYVKISSPDEIGVESRKVVGNRQFWETFELNENDKLALAKDEL